MKIIKWSKQNYLLLVILFTASALRFYHIDFQSLWVDEIYSLNESNPSFTIPELYKSIVTSDPHPPLYFVLAYIFFSIFGYTAFVLKMLSAILSIAGVYALYLLGRELFSKKVGLLAAALISVNYFSIYYAQEGRMYSLLFLTTVLSFYYLIRFLKSPTIRTAILFGLFSTLMIYSHLFALFTLFSQYLILLYFVIKPFETKRKQIFRYGLVIGFMNLILYIPVISIILNNLSLDSFWIKMPALDVFTQFFKDFFGQCESVIFFALLLICMFFRKLLSTEDSKSFQINPHTDKMVFAFLVLFIWIFITLLLPLIRTYTSLPILVNRYFINILPAIIVMMAVGLAEIKNKIIRHGLLAMIVVMSLTDIIVVKKYYTTVNKSQFREVSEFIVSNNAEKSPVVTSLGPYFPFYLNNGKVKTKIIDQPLQAYVNEMMQDSTKRQSFWYTDAHNNPLNLDEKAKEYLSQNFTVAENIELYDAWANYYVFGQDVKIDVSAFDLTRKNSGDPIKFWIENFEVTPDFIKISGWAYIDEEDAKNSNLKLVFISEKNEILPIDTKQVFRPDITKSVGNKFDLNNSGFVSGTPTKDVPTGEYKIGIIVRNALTKKQGLVITDKLFKK